MDFKEVLQNRGWWLRRGVGQGSSTKKATHLLLDGGRLHVPDEDSGQFLNEYALALARKQTPSVVELRTPVFKMFMDFDARLPLGTSDTHDFSEVWTSVYGLSTQFFAHAPRMVVCTAPIKHEPDAKKFGAHLVWPETFARAEVALAFRQMLIDHLRAAFGDGLCVNSWEDVVDACVYKANGLRAVWSIKGPGDKRPYAPTEEVAAGGAVTKIETPVGVAALREWVHALSIRGTVGDAPTPLQEGIDVPVQDTAGGGAGGGGNGSKERLDAYCHVLPHVETALPEEFKPQQFTGLFRTPNTVMLRSSSHFCRNLGRAHKSNTVYFVVSRAGMTQRCFCRCETTDGRKHGMCKDFESEVFTLPETVLDALLLGQATGEDADGVVGAAPEVLHAASMPSHKPQKLEALLSMGVKARVKKPFKNRR